MGDPKNLNLAELLSQIGGHELIHDLWAGTSVVASRDDGQASSEILTTVKQAASDIQKVAVAISDAIGSVDETIEDINTIIDKVVGTVNKVSEAASDIAEGVAGFTQMLSGLTSGTLLITGALALLGLGGGGEMGKVLQRLDKIEDRLKNLEHGLEALGLKIDAVYAEIEKIPGWLNHREFLNRVTELKASCIATKSVLPSWRILIEQEASGSTSALLELYNKLIDNRIAFDEERKLLGLAVEPLAVPLMLAAMNTEMIVLSVLPADVRKTPAENSRDFYLSYFRSVVDNNSEISVAAELQRLLDAKKFYLRPEQLGQSNDVYQEQIQWWESYWVCKARTLRYRFIRNDTQMAILKDYHSEISDVPVGSKPGRSHPGGNGEPADIRIDPPGRIYSDFATGEADFFSRAKVHIEGYKAIMGRLISAERQIPYLGQVCLTAMTAYTVATDLGQWGIETIPTDH